MVYRPKIVPRTPLEYKNLMEQCWDVDPLKRPDIITLLNKIDKLNLYYQNMSNESIQLEKSKNFEISNVNSIENYTSSRIFTSKVYQFDNFPEPRNATEGILLFNIEHFFVNYFKCINK